MPNKPKSANKEQAAYGGAYEATIKLQIKPLEEGGYLATSEDVPGLVAEGRTMAETTEIAQGLARKIAESCLAHGDPLPPANPPIIRLWHNRRFGN